MKTPTQRRHVALLGKAIRDHCAEHAWPPSQRELAKATGIRLDRVNEILHMMETDGLIQLGPGPRQIRIVGAQMIIPEEGT